MTGRGHSAGFTLFEMLVVLAILALLAGLFPMAAGSFLSPRAGIEGEAEGIAAFLREARGLARKTGTPQSVRLEGARALRRQPDEAAFMLRRAAALRLAPTPGFAATPAAITFFPDGTSNGGTVDLLHGQAPARVSVEPILARVRVGDG